MAKNTSLFGKVSGKIGAVVFSTSGGQTISREYNPHVSNPNTQAQIDQRARMKLMSQLSAALNQRIEDEQISAEEAETLAVPTGFPLTGTASMTPALDDPNETQVTKITEDNKDTATGNPIVLFDSAAGNSVIASGSGTVQTVTTDVKFGNMVTIDHGNGYISIYRNSGDPLVTEGSAIDKGDIIFVISDNNISLGYQIQQNEQYIDPEELIEING